MTAVAAEPPSSKADDEVSALIEALHETSQRLEELTAGEVDAVASRDGKTFLLRHAQDQLRHSEAAKQAAILNALPAHIALLNTDGVIVSVNEAWRKFNGAGIARRPDHDVGNNYLVACGRAGQDAAPEAHQIAEGVRSVLEGTAKKFAAEYEYRLATEPESYWFLVTITPLSESRLFGAVVMHLNITEQKQHAVDRKNMEVALFAEKERAHVTLNSIGDGVMCTDAAGNITFFNLAAEAISGWKREDALTRPMAQVLRILDASTRMPIHNAMALGVAQNRTTELTNRILIRQDGTEIPIEDTIAQIFDHEGNAAGAVVVFRDVSTARSMALQMTHSAHHDFLTGLPNRMLLNDRVSQAIALAPRHRKNVAVLFLDLDGFKHINDSLGHSVGDKLLKSVADRLADCVRGSDTVSRQGGDEFVVLLSEIDVSEDAATSARRMLQAIAEPHSIDQNELHVTASIGVSVYPDDGVNAETLIKNADTAMYQAKEKGRQGYQFFLPAMNVRAVERQSIEESLRRALERNEFSLQYQPKIDLETGAITGAEALIRWTHPTRGTVSPLEFISVAEDCGLILPIGAWVLREACRQGKAWADAGLPLVTIAVNVSAMQFRHENFLGGVFASLQQTGFDPSRLELELTESVLMNHAEAAVAVLLELRRKGVQVAIDDFGTGYSSLSYLRTFAVDSLKIDQSFVRQISTAEDGAPIVTAVIAMAQSLKLRVVAEGVETLEEATFLRAHKCDEAQGYYFSRPVAPQQFARLLKAGRMEPSPLPERLETSFA